MTSLDLGWLTSDRGGRYPAGSVIVGAGLYELTVEQLSLAAAGARGLGHPLRSGLVHGLDCVGCSGGLMAALFVLGVMGVFCVAVVAAAIFAEKVLPRGDRLSGMLALALVVLGVWVAASPASVPGLTEPTGSPSMQMSP